MGLWSTLVSVVKTVAPIVQAGAAVAGVAASIQQGRAQEKFADQQAAQSTQRLFLERQDRLRVETNAKAQVHREARQKRAAIFNAAANNGILTSSVAEGGGKSVTSSANRSLRDINKASKISAAGEALSQNQIDLNKSIAKDNAKNVKIGGVLDFGASITNIASDLN
jgi:hypothetical protein